MNFNLEMQEHTQNIQKILCSFLPKEEGFQKTVLQAMNYSMLVGGKRLRPMLMQEAYQMFGGKTKVIEPFMAAIEMIHTHSLIHDDLPALDNDEYRRGQQSTWKAYGETMGILAGDSLLNYAYETVCTAFSMEPCIDRIGQAITLLTKKTGVYGMLGGQCVDVEATGQELSVEQLLFIYRMKTSALIEAAMMTGAILAGANQEEVCVMEKIGEKVGIAFQIQDDILDVTGTKEELGKPVFSDDKNKKTTYITLQGLEQAKYEVENLSKEALLLFDGLEKENDFLRKLIEQLVCRKR